MALNLAKYRNQLLEAWKDIVDEKTPNDWALFGYEKQTNDVKVISTGDGGLDELANEFNSGKVMYAFCRVTDPNTELPKFVFINWQGEGAPPSRKGTCANHVAELSNLLKGAHVTINARTEDDIETSVVLEKVSKASASKFNFKERSDPVGNVAPVSSVYKRILPTREINSIEREKFWEKERAEEKERVIVERKKAEEEHKKLDTERKEREMRENAARDIVVKERAHSISQLKEAEKNADNVSRTQVYEKMQWERQLEDDAQEEKKRRTRSESLRRERSHEAQNLISQRTINARAIFEQNTCAGQLSSSQTNRQPKILQEFAEFEAASRSDVGQADDLTFRDDVDIAHANNLASRSDVGYANDFAPRSDVGHAHDFARRSDVGHVDIIIPDDEPEPVMSPEDNEDVFAKEEVKPDEFSYTKNDTKTRSFSRQDYETGEDIEEEQDWGEPGKESPNAQDPLAELLAEHEREMNQAIKDSNQILSSQADDGLRARALYDYQAADETEISFDPDDMITQIEQIDEGWWQGMAPDGTYGLFPANYVELC